MPRPLPPALRKLLMNDTYVCLPVTEPAEAGLDRTVCTVNRLPWLPGPSTSISTTWQDSLI
jgi:hypothetical protein